MHPNTTVGPDAIDHAAVLAHYAAIDAELHLDLAVTSRAEWPQFVVRTETVYRVAAPTAARALQWFADPSDIDLDVETLDFGTVEIIRQLAPDTSAAAENKPVGVA